MRVSLFNLHIFLFQSKLLLSRQLSWNVYNYYQLILQCVCGVDKCCCMHCRLQLLLTYCSLTQHFAACFYLLIDLSDRTQDLSTPCFIKYNKNYWKTWSYINTSILRSCSYDTFQTFHFFDPVFSIKVFKNCLNCIWFTLTITVWWRQVNTCLQACRFCAKLNTVSVSAKNLRILLLLVHCGGALWREEGGQKMRRSGHQWTGPLWL